MADESQYILKCPFGEPPAPDNDLYTYLVKEWKNYPDNVAVIESENDHEVTYAQLHDAILAVSRDMRRAGLKQGETVSIWCSNSVQLMVVSMAAWRLGACTAYIGFSLTAEEAHRQIRMVNTSILMVDRITKEKAAEVLTGLHCRPLFSVGRKGQHDLISLKPQVGQPDPDNAPVSINQQDTAVILFSSGTTGLPKAAELTHKSMTISLQCSNAQTLGGPLPTTVLFQPMSHLAGLYNILRAFQDGVTVIVMPRFDLEDYLRVVSKHRIWILLIVPAVAVMMINNPELVKKYDLSHVIAFYSSTAPLGKGTIDKLQQLLPNTAFTVRVSQAYGMTESCGAITRHPSLPYPHECPLHSVGLVAPYIQLKVVDVDTGKALPAGKEGELVVRGDVLMKGYYGDPESTRKIIDKDGWLHTGDIGYYEDTGYVFIVDRAKELIKHKGMQVAPAELEDILLSHPDVEDAAVVGQPDELAGEKPFAFVVRRAGSKLSEGEVANYVAGKVAPYKRLTGGVRFIQTIPRLPSGKILRRVLKESLKKAKL